MGWGDPEFSPRDMLNAVKDLLEISRRLALSR
jgi:hypothetical protein